MSKKFDLIIDKIRELFHEPKEFIPLHSPTFIGNEKAYLNECIDSTYVSSVGSFVDKIEVEIAKYVNSKFAIACVNGTSALHMALLLAGVKSGQEVITQPITFIATANAISYIGAQPVFVDVDKDTLGLSPEKLEYFLKNATFLKVNKDTNRHETINKVTGKRITACIPMHTFGHPCRIDTIAEICKKYHVELVEDAAESLGSWFKGKHTGTFGKIGVLSFNGNKIITSGGGGVLLMDDEKLAQKAKHLTTQAKVPHQWNFVHDSIGYNYRMPNINAALACAQLENIDNFLKVKRKLAVEYFEYFNSIGIEFFIEPEGAKSNYWLNNILLNNCEEKNDFLAYSYKKNIMTRPSWELMQRLEMFKNCQQGDLSNAEYLADRIVSLPSSPNIEN